MRQDPYNNNTICNQYVAMALLVGDQQGITLPETYIR